MSKAKKQLRMIDWRDLHRGHSRSETFPRDSTNYRLKNRDDRPQISDLLGCFCVQTGAQFG